MVLNYLYINRLRTYVYATESTVGSLSGGIRGCISRRSMRTTLKLLAEEFAVDKATVSRAICGKAGVNPDLRRRIVARAAELGYSPNVQARSLSTGLTDTLALIFCDESSRFFENPFYTTVLSGIAAETFSHRLNLTFYSLSSCHYNADAVLPEQLRGNRADGFLFVGNQQNTLIAATQENNIPFVLIDHTVPGISYPAVVIDNEPAAHAATEHLLRLGHKRIAFVSGSLRCPSFRERLAGYTTALHAYGLPIKPELVCDDDLDDSYSRMRNLLAMEHPPTAVFAANDALAIQAMRAVYDRGLRIPQDISIIGFDDSRCSTDAWPGLTTMHVDKELMGRLGVKKLIGLTGKRRLTPVVSSVRARLLVRESTAPPLPTSAPTRHARKRSRRA